MFLWTLFYDELGDIHLISFQNCLFQTTWSWFIFHTLATLCFFVSLSFFFSKHLWNCSKNFCSESVLRSLLRFYLLLWSCWVWALSELLWWKLCGPWNSHCVKCKICLLYLLCGDLLFSQYRIPLGNYIICMYEFSYLLWNFLYMRWIYLSFSKSTLQNVQSAKLLVQ